MQVYLDNSATTKCYEEVRDVVGELMCIEYGNPSSVHNMGFTAEKYITWSKDVFANIMKVQAKEIYFTSGGTESDNLALQGVARANKRAGKHLITTGIEHPAILNTMIYLEEEGYEITFLSVDERGMISLEELEAALRPDTILVSIMHVNNEIGTVQPIEQAAKIIKLYNRNIIVHVDAVQGFGKYRIMPKRMGIDMVSVSGHKIHGPKGSGMLYVDQKVKISPIMFGGEQQGNLRSGTENVPGIVGLATAAKEIYRNIDENHRRTRQLKEYLMERVLEIEDVVIHGADGSDSAPHILSVGFAGVRSEVLLHTLEDRGIYVSAGSACASNHPGISGVLKSVGVSKTYIESTIRFSLSEFTTKEEIDYTVETLYNCIPTLRRFVRR